MNPQQFFRGAVPTWTAPTHYLNQYWNMNILEWTIRNKFQQDFNRNSNIFIDENTFGNVVYQMSVILSRPQCAKDIDVAVVNRNLQNRDGDSSNDVLQLDTNYSNCLLRLFVGLSPIYKFI